MWHQIATSLCLAQPFEGLSFVSASPSPVALFVAFLDQPGNVNVFQQLPPAGVWSGSMPGAGSPPVQLRAPAGITFTSIAGIPNYLIALGSDGNLYASVFSQTGTAPQGSDWSTFTAFPLLDNVINAEGTVPINDFCAVQLLNALVIVAAFNAQGVAGFYSYNLSLAGSPTNLPQAIRNNAAFWNPLGPQENAIGVLGAFAPSLAVAYQTWTPTIVFVGIPPYPPENPAPLPTSWTSSDGVNWSIGNLSQVLTAYQPGLANYMPTSMLLTLGNPNSTFQAIVLNSGTPMLCYSGDGSHWAYYGNLPPNNPAQGTQYISNPPNINTLASGFGNSNNLQVVGLGSDLYYPANSPFLIWQDTMGNWYFFPYDPSNDRYLSLVNGFNEPALFPTDVAMGTGWCDQGPALQVAYLGNDNNVYVTWQDPFGGWHWYPGLQGAGLP